MTASRRPSTRLTRAVGPATHELALIAGLYALWQVAHELPSIHVAWAAVVSLGVMAATTSRWRWLFLLHFVITMLAVSASGHHWWLDGIVVLALLGVALGIDTAARALARNRRSPRSLAVPS